MRTIRTTLAAILLLAGSLTGAVAQESDEQKKALGKLVEAYSAIAVGWWVEEKCSHLSRDLKQEFEWHLSEIGGWATRLKNPNLFRSMVASARKVAEEEHSECDADNENLIVHSLVSARRLSKSLTGREYRPGVSFPTYILRKYSRAAIGIEILMADCDPFEDSPEIKADVLSTYRKLSDYLTEKYPAPMKRISENLEQQKARTSSFDCNKQVNADVANSLRALRQIERSLGL